jgi:transcriptional regulator with XRE-family HTH domain
VGLIPGSGLRNQYPGSTACDAQPCFASFVELAIKYTSIKNLSSIIFNAMKKIDLHLDYAEIKCRIEADKDQYGVGEWAKMVGVSIATVSNIHGKKAKVKPSIGYIVAVARVIGKPIEWYLYGEKQTFQAAESRPEYNMPGQNSPIDDPLAGCSEDIRKACLKLKDIYESNDEVIVPALRANLAAFHDSIGRRTTIKELKKDLDYLKREVQYLKELNDPAGPLTGTG